MAPYSTLGKNDRRNALPRSSHLIEDKTLIEFNGSFRIVSDQACKLMNRDALIRHIFEVSAMTSEM